MVPGDPIWRIVMAVSVGDRIPDVEIHTMREGSPVAVRTGDVLGHGRVVPPLRCSTGSGATDRRHEGNAEHDNA
jgi:hypothetical protein